MAASLRAAAFKALSAVALRRGDPDAGVVFIKVLARSGLAVLFGQTIDADGAPCWRRLSGPEPVPEADVDARLEREARIDPDIWALEIMDDDFAHPLDPTLI